MLGGAVHTPDTLTVDGTTYIRAYPVAPGRCPHCGNQTRTWTPARIIQKLQAWANQYGTTPSATKLNVPERGYPSTRVVCDYFGSWDGALQAAGLPPAEPAMVWTRERILEAMLAWANQHGDAPTAKDWLGATANHPASRTVLVRFGTWNAAIDAAGFFPRGPWGVRLRPTVGPSGGGGFVEAGPVVAALEDYLGADGTVESLASRMGVDPTPLSKLRRGERPRLRHRAADELLTAIGRPDVLANLEAA